MLLLSLILGHLIADFYLQTDAMVKEKRKNIGKHIFHHFVVTALILTGFFISNVEHSTFLLQMICPLFVIVGSHYIIDILKINILDNLSFQNDASINRLGFFILDQILHLGVIILISHYFIGVDLSNIISVFQVGHQLKPINTTLFILIIIILNTSVSGHMIRILLGSLPTQLLTFEGKYSYKTGMEENHYRKMGRGNVGVTEEFHYPIFNVNDLSRGKIIGYIERMLVLIMTFYNAYPAIGFIVAAKSIARFKQMDDRNWAEYFLLGTLTSMFIGISLGIILRQVLT